MSTLQSIALIIALALHHPWVKDRLEHLPDMKRPAVWFDRGGFWYGWTAWRGGLTHRRRLFRWPLITEARK